jgi:hypothetical protein
MKYLFITGLYRSGSTLLEKLLHNHGNILVGGQPFPYLYFDVKKEFLDSLHLERRYPLGQMFLEDDYRMEDFYRFLSQEQITEDSIIEIIQRMQGYSGQTTQGFSQYLLDKGVRSGMFETVYSGLMNQLVDFLGGEDLVYAGSKEIFCEEYIPFFLKRDIKCVVILRDPRDVIASLNYGKGSLYTGDVRPTLFIIRQWRQSVSFCLSLDGHPYFFYLKYEDLVNDLWFYLDKITEFLDVPKFSRDQFQEGIIDQDGTLWKGNSSFSEHSFVSSTSVGKYAEVVPEQTIRYIEYLCQPEFNALGYENNYEIDDKILHKFSEPLEVTHKSFNKDFSVDPAHIHQEEERFSQLKKKIDENEQMRWFIFPEAYQKLRNYL